MQDQNKNGRFHYGLEFVFNCSSVEVEEKIRELGTKPNRRAKEKRDKENGVKKLSKLNRELRKAMATGNGDEVMAKLNRTYRNLFKMRMKA